MTPAARLHLRERLLRQLHPDLPHHRVPEKLHESPAAALLIELVAEDGSESAPMVAGDERGKLTKLAGPEL